MLPDALVTTTAPSVYSLWYNGSYMLPEILITAVLACILVPWVQKTFPRR